MPEHDAHQHHDGEFHGDCPECVESRSSTPNLHLPKAKRWKVENKVVDGEGK